MARRKKSEQADASAATSSSAAQAPSDTQPVKRRPGRPRKSEVAAAPATPAKRGPGRPRKTEGAAPAAKKPGRRGRPRKAASPSIGQQIDELIRQLQSLKDQIGKMEANAGKLDRVLSALES
jgi:hypothetical protein